MIDLNTAVTRRCRSGRDRLAVRAVSAEFCFIARRRQRTNAADRRGDSARRASLSQPRVPRRNHPGRQSSLIALVVLSQVPGSGMSILTAVAFVFAAPWPQVLSGYIGMYIAVRANVRTAQAASQSLNQRTARRLRQWHRHEHHGRFAGAAGHQHCCLSYSSINWAMRRRRPRLLAGFGFGGTSIAIFARVGGGIYTKAADVGADLVGKTEAGIPEDDPRNPATIADNVGDNVGDVAGMGSDLFESYASSIIAAISLATTVRRFRSATGCWRRRYFRCWWRRPA